MRLIDAFREIGPIMVEMNRSEISRMQSAARLILATLDELVQRELRGRDFSAADRDAVTQDIAFRLVRSGPRGVRPGDPDHDGGVRGWLTFAVRNGARDIWRRRARFRQPGRPGDLDRGGDPLDRLPADDSVGDEAMTTAIDKGRAAAILAAARKYLFAVLVPSVVARKDARSPRAGQRFQAAFLELRRAVRDEVDVNALAAESLRADGFEVTGERLSRRRAALDKRYQRVREALLDRVEREERAGEIDALTARAMVALVQEELYLQRRSDAVVQRAAAGKSPRQRRRHDSGSWGPS